MANSPKTQTSRRQFIQSGVLAAAGAGLAGSSSWAWVRHSDSFKDARGCARVLCALMCSGADREGDKGPGR